jgi:hypothetical protein
MTHDGKSCATLLERERIPGAWYVVVVSQHKRCARIRIMDVVRCRYNGHCVTSCDSADNRWEGLVVGVCHTLLTLEIRVCSVKSSGHANQAYHGVTFAVNSPPVSRRTGLARRGTRDFVLAAFRTSSCPDKPVRVWRCAYFSPVDDCSRWMTRD